MDFMPIYDAASRRRLERQPIEKPIPRDAYPVIDTDLARDNLENDLPAADLEEL